jgi:cell division protease FtsH
MASQNNEKTKETDPSKFSIRNIPMFRWLILVLLLSIGVQVFWSWYQHASSVPYTTFLDMVKNGKIGKVSVDQNTITAMERSSGSAQPRTLIVIVPASIPDRTLMELLLANKVEIVAVQDNSGFWSNILWFLIPMAGVFIFFYFTNARNRAQGSMGGGGLLSMGKMNAEMYSKEKVKTTFADVAGSKEQKEALYEIIHFLKRPEDFHRLGGTTPKGVLLVGPPGTGKTLLARAVAGESGVPFFHVSGSGFLEMLVGVGASRVRDLFNTAKKQAPCIVFVDEIDSIGRRRGGIQGFYGGGASEMEQTLNQLLSEMDGFEPNEDIIVMAATNQPEVLDPALLRPGRFDRRILIDLPNLSEREDILKVHVRRTPLADDIDLREIARATPGNSGADLKNLVNEAAILASKMRRDKVLREDFFTALDTIILGQVRSSLILSTEEKRRTAYHEGGHALVGKLLPNSDPVTKVTIVPRGRSLGVTMQTPIDERHNYTRDYLEDRLTILLGGRAAEEIAYGSISTGAENDLSHCTTLARNMVARYGMSEGLGNFSLMDPSANSFLNDNPFGSQRNFSEETLQLVDKETKALIDKAYGKALTLLRGRKDILDRIAEALITHEILEGADLNAIIDAAEGEKSE